jgi:hypothetical protein
MTISFETISVSLTTMSFIMFIRVESDGKSPPTKRMADNTMLKILIKITRLLSFSNKSYIITKHNIL